ncbi:MAG: GntR family transcriptional regulator [Armatimonadota bacterium]|nr:GntR family transcriptional regulator [Armatimonadota bacterium]
MILRINTASSTPVYSQIVYQIKRAIASGSLKRGDSLPSLRETAIKLRVNPLTVSKAYKSLEIEGLIETRHGLGSFVAGDGGGTTDKFRQDILTHAIDDALADAYNLGVSFVDVRKLLEERIIAANNGFPQAEMKRSDKNER